MTVFPTLGTILAFGTMFRRLTHNPQLDAMGTRTEQKRKGCDTGGKYSYIIFFVFGLWELMVGWSFVRHKLSKKNLVLHIVWDYDVD